MKIDNQRFESFLREFVPREPRPLPEHAPSPAFLWRRLLAAAVVLIAASASLWFVTRPPNQPNPPQAKVFAPAPPEGAPSAARLSLLQLTRLAETDPQKFDALLDADSRNVLPRLQGQRSTLAVLAKE